jgi:hypothetical protein
MAYRKFLSDIEQSTVITKIKECPIYAQNFYAALCNNGWRNPTLTNIITSHMQWREAAGVVADLRGNGGNYCAWYCSGIGTKLSSTTNGVTRIEVSEGTVTPEIEQDLLQLNWIIARD